MMTTKTKTIDLQFADNLELGDKFLTLAADEVISSDELKAVDGVAYSGGPVGQSWSGYPIVVSLSGMTFSKQTPLLFNHYNTPVARLGAVTPEIKANKLNVAGGIDPEVEAAQTILKTGKKVQWQLSIGAAIKKMKFIDKGETFEANGKTFDGPAYHVQQSHLREVSVVAVGADDDTYLNIAASLSLPAPKQKEASNMKKELMQFIIAKYNLGGDVDESAIVAKLKEVGSSADSESREMQAIEAEKVRIQAAATLESTRIDGIRAECGEYGEIRDEAIKAGWSVDQAKKIIAAINTKVKAHGAPGGGNFIVKSGPEMTAGAIEAAICNSQGIKNEVVEAGMADKDLECASKHLRGLTLRGAIELCARMENISTGLTFGDETIRAGLLDNLPPWDLVQRGEQKGTSVLSCTTNHRD